MPQALVDGTVTTAVPEPAEDATRRPVEPATALLALARPFLRALRANARPALLLQGSIALVIAAYAWLPPVGSALDAVARWKATYGYGFSLPSTLLFGGVLPLVVQRLRGGALRPRAALLLLAYWLAKGWEVDAFYRAQSWLFGDASALAVAAKVLVDQLLFVPLWGAPSQAWVYALADADLDVARARARMGPRWYRERVVAVLVSSWIVWGPTVAAIYALPAALRLPVANLMMCLWALILASLARDAADARPAAAVAA